MKNGLSSAMIFLIVLSAFAILNPQVKAQSDENLTPENPYADTEPSWSPDGGKIVRARTH